VGDDVGATDVGDGVGGSVTGLSVISEVGNELGATVVWTGDNVGATDVGDDVGATDVGDDEGAIDVGDGVGSSVAGLSVISEVGNELGATVVWTGNNVGATDVGGGIGSSVTGLSVILEVGEAVGSITGKEIGGRLGVGRGAGAGLGFFVGDGVGGSGSTDCRSALFHVSNNSLLALRASSPSKVGNPSRAFSYIHISVDDPPY
jgi:hypothetical protein